MQDARTRREEVARRADEIYERDLRAKLEPEHTGEFLVLNVETGEYELDADILLAGKRAAAKFPANASFMMRVGYPAAARIGGRFSVAQP